jgi:hypothetical protein
MEQSHGGDARFLAFVCRRGDGPEPVWGKTCLLERSCDRGFDLGGRSSFAAADAGYDHGFTHTH